MKVFILFFISTITIRLSYSQCFYKGLPYNVGVTITFDNGQRNHCECIIPTPNGQACNAHWVVVGTPTSPPTPTPTPTPPPKPVFVLPNSSPPISFTIYPGEIYSVSGIP